MDNATLRSVDLLIAQTREAIELAKGLKALWKELPSLDDLEQYAKELRDTIDLLGKVSREWDKLPLLDDVQEYAKAASECTPA